MDTVSPSFLHCSVLLGNCASQPAIFGSEIFQWQTKHTLSSGRNGHHHGRSGISCVSPPFTACLYKCSASLQRPRKAEDRIQQREKKLRDSRSSSGEGRRGKKEPDIELSGFHPEQKQLLCAETEPLPSVLEFTWQGSVTCKDCVAWHSWSGMC